MLLELVLLLWTITAVVTVVASLNSVAAAVAVGSCSSAALQKQCNSIAAAPALSADNFCFAAVPTTSWS